MTFYAVPLQYYTNKQFSCLPPHSSELLFLVMIGTDLSLEVELNMSETVPTGRDVPSRVRVLGRVLRHFHYSYSAEY